MKLDIIINGNTLDELDKIPDNSIDLIFADPPYWMRTDGILKRAEGTEFNGVFEDWDKFKSLDDYEYFTGKWLKACRRVLKKDGSIWVIGGMQCIYTVGAVMQRLGFWFINDIIWHKSNPTPNFRGTRFNNSHETLIWATKSKKAKYTFNYKTMKELNTDNVSQIEHEKGIRKQMGSVWRMPVSSGHERLKDSDGQKLHSAQKPEQLLRRVIAATSKIGDVVLDPFGGTMTTGAVAKRMGRHYIMIEKDKKYCDYGEQRLSNILPEIGPIEKAKYDEKPLRVSLQEMIENSFLKAGEYLYLKKSYRKAKLTEDAKIYYLDKTFDIHTGAAIVGELKSDRVNGFDYWLVKRNNKYVPLKQIREQYRAFKGKQVSIEKSN